MPPKIKIYGKIKPGFSVYLMKDEKAITTDKKKSDPRFPFAIGEIDKQSQLQLNGISEDALRLVC